MIQVSVVQPTYLSLCHLCVSQAVLWEDKSLAPEAKAKVHLSEGLTCLSMRIAHLFSTVQGYL